MAKADSIAPFPADINRDAFGSWLSGLVDGEGSFGVVCQRDKKGIRKFNPRITFNLALRADDTEVLQLIQAFWQCGTLRGEKKSPGARYPLSRFEVVKISDLYSVVVPHFLAYPLRAKKRNDFEVWRQAVELFHTVHLRPRRTAGYRLGNLPKWTVAEFGQLEQLAAAIKEARAFKETKPVYIGTSRKVIMLTWNGETFPLREWSKRTGVCFMTLYNRVLAGWPDERVLTTPVRQAKD